MKFKILMLACTLGAIVSCQKNTDSNVGSELTNGQTKDVRLLLSGEIITSESTLGKKISNTQDNAKELRDSTVYYITVLRSNIPVYNGLYNRVDTVILKIPNSGEITVTALAVRRGSGPGLYCYRGGNNIVYPWFGRYLSNTLDTVNSNGVARTVDSLGYANLFNEDGTNVNGTTTLHSEVDSYVGRITFNAINTPAEINLNMRRTVFGIRYNVSNFNNGRLIADFSGLMPTKYFASTSDFSKQFIYTASELNWADSLHLNPVDVKIKWEKPDGSIVSIGQKRMSFKRNVLTNIYLTIPNETSGIPSMPIDTNWIRSENIVF
jgi:hypothetical protein